MDELERTALREVRLDWAPTREDVWRPASPFDVGHLNHSVREQILDAFAEAGPGTAPIGVVMVGQRGSGKTHALGALRERVQAAGGFFFVVDLLDAANFWRCVAMALADGLGRVLDDGTTQLGRLMRHLVDRPGVPRSVRRALTEDTDSGLTRQAVDTAVDMIRKLDRRVGLECQDTARALALYASRSDDERVVGYDFLTANDEVMSGDRIGWGIRHERTPREIVRDVTRILALAGPTMIAIDQIDQVLSQSRMQLGQNSLTESSLLMVEQIAGGLMALRESTERTLSVLACLSSSWDLIQKYATDTVQDRFRAPLHLSLIRDDEIARQIVAKRFAVFYNQVGFRPPYPTWPILPAAFTGSGAVSPRQLLRRVHEHISACLRDDELRELSRLDDEESTSGSRRPQDEPRLAELDRQFEELLAEADPGPALDQHSEDALMPGLLEAALSAWMIEHDPAEKEFSVDQLAGTSPVLHGRLRRTLDEQNETEEHWAFRAVAARHHIAALNRLRNAITAAGVTNEAPRRRLFLLRSTSWSQGPKTRETLRALDAAGGRTLPVSDDDVRLMIALERMLGGRTDEAIRNWLTQRRPTARIEFLARALADADTQDAMDIRLDDGGSGVDRAAAGNPLRLAIGQVEGTGRPAVVELEALRRHVVVFAGSGSGKTVLLRRLIEECALLGVSSIVLDVNNDLARLGESWPQPPAGWWDGDAARAREYLESVDVVVWTPGRAAGRPVSFQPLPHFADVLNDPDEFDIAVRMAASALEPRARLEGRANRNHLARAVLRQAVSHYARTGRSDLREFIDLLDDLPDTASDIANAPKIAAELAQILRATAVTDTLFGGSGVPVDPRILLTPPEGRRARVSVISFVGLPDDEAKQGFVHQLQVALFGWIKRNPAAGRPLGGLLVMDEAQNFAPSGAATPCTDSTLALASQARKYGLGLVFATQAPKGLHNKVSGNAATQLFGLLSAPAQIAAAREMARAKGSDIADIGRLHAGQFYAAIEGAEFVRVRTPMCLSHHGGPLTDEDVLRAARGG